MSRKITRESIKAFIGCYNFNKDNTSVDEVARNNSELFLHGNCIASNKDGKIEVTTAGWNTTTTRERLNGIPGVQINTRKGQLYLNGEKWDGGWISI